MKTSKEVLRSFEEEKKNGQKEGHTERGGQEDGCNQEPGRPQIRQVRCVCKSASYHNYIDVRKG